MEKNLISFLNSTKNITINSNKAKKNSLYFQANKFSESVKIREKNVAIKIDKPHHFSWYHNLKINMYYMMLNTKMYTAFLQRGIFISFNGFVHRNQCIQTEILEKYTNINICIDRSSQAYYMLHTVTAWNSCNYSTCGIQYARVDWCRAPLLAIMNALRPIHVMID